MFEALFDRRLKPTGEFAAELRAAGYDAAQALPKYPTEVWTRCLELARRHRWPQASQAEAYRQLGREFSQGFLETLVGRLVNAAIPFMSPQSFLNRLASYFRMGREDSGLSFDVVERTAASARVEVHNPAAVPGTFVAGIVEIALERMKRQGTVEVLQKSPTDYELLVRWL
jgi:uncharacterized protein (TIGR02265 family)